MWIILYTYNINYYYRPYPVKTVTRFVGQNAAISTNDWCHVLLSISFWSVFGNIIIGSLNRHCLKFVKNIWAPISNMYSSKTSQKIMIDSIINFVYTQKITKRLIKWNFHGWRRNDVHKRPRNYNSRRETKR